MEANDKIIEAMKDELEANGFMSFESFKAEYGKTVKQVLSIELLSEHGLRVSRLEGEKVLTFANKTQSALHYLKGHGTVHVETLYELNNWDAHVLGSVFRRPVREKHGITKMGPVLEYTGNEMVVVTN